ncbi:phosphoribosylamine--glycine ligase [Candidatus Woesebacteria bacterium]|nr:phosphoribosylamine--glycine ligase [Candidatus Woesebacteria bacterium]
MSLKTPQRILIVGSGGREHAIAWKIRQHHKEAQLFFAPGNGGTATLGANIGISATDVEGIVVFVNDNKIELTIIGPETALEAGVSNALTAAGHAVFGPTKEAAQLETSKAFSADFMAAHNIPHPQSWIFSDADAAIAHIKNIDTPIVIKASSIAAGKGVFLPDNQEEAINVIKTISEGSVSGITKDKILIQERLIGREASILAFSDGKTVVPLIPAQDHKRAYDNDEGPNTGGMGSFAPSNINPRLLSEIKETILQPTVDGMSKMGMPYKGVLYAGIMLTKGGPKVIEFNARFGDPETQPLMMMLSSDVIPIFLSCIEGSLSNEQVKFKIGAAVCVVLAEKGYPGEYTNGNEIFGLEKSPFMENIEVFHAGTVNKESKIFTAGGRVLGVTAYGTNVEDAKQKAYGVIGNNGVWFKEMEFRTDIGTN